MIPENMLFFLTSESIKNHMEYMNTVYAKFSIYEKSIPSLSGKSINEIVRMRLDKNDKENIISLLKEYHSHKTYFNSFAKNDRPCKEIKRFYTSENDFCYRVIERARAERTGFIYIINDRKGKPFVFHSSEREDVYITVIPTLALDLCEHAYFADYGFNRDEYIRRAVARLDISRLFIQENT